MPKYKLLYFNLRGRAEPARMIFALAGCEYVDDRFTHEEWPRRKPDTEMFPIGQAPVLLVDDKVIPQSGAISRYLARELNFYGANSLEATQIDVIIETMGDIKDQMIPLFANQDAAKKAEVTKAFIETTSKPYFSYLDQLIQKAGGQHFVGNKVSLADIHVFNMLDMMTNSKYKIEGLLDSYPNLSAFCKSFRDEGPLKSYLESRPVTEA